MQISVNEENWSNFRDSLNSDLTRQIYEQCLNRFLLYCDSDLESMLKLEPQKITTLIIKYLSELRISFQYKNQILCAIKHACEMNDVLLNWAKIEEIKINLDELNSKLKLTSDKQKRDLIRKYAGGFCTICYSIPTKKIIYDIGGAKLVERYCDKCFNFRKEGRSKKDIDRLN